MAEARKKVTHLTTNKGPASLTLTHELSKQLPEIVPLGRKPSSYAGHAKPSSSTPDYAVIPSFPSSSHTPITPSPKIIDNLKNIEALRTSESEPQNVYDTSSFPASASNDQSGSQPKQSLNPISDDANDVAMTAQQDPEDASAGLKRKSNVSRKKITYPKEADGLLQNVQIIERDGNKIIEPSFVNWPPAYHPEYGFFLRWDASCLQWGVEPLLDVFQTLEKYHKLIPEAIDLERNRVEAAGAGTRKSVRVDLRLLRMMTDMGLTVNQEPKIGTVPGIGVGSRFISRAQMAIVGLHSKWMDGIDYATFNGTSLGTAVVKSGHQYNDEDTGYSLLYEGSGKVKSETELGKLTRGNLALSNSCQLGLPVRVIRGWPSGNKMHFQFDGLYKVQEWYAVKKISSENVASYVYKFQLIRLEGQGPTPVPPAPKSAKALEW